MSVEIKASFTKDTKIYNGLNAIADDLIDKPLEEHYVIAKVRCSRTNIDHLKGGVHTPQVEFHHIEVMLSDKEEQAAKKLFDAACKARLGEVPQQTLFEDKDEPDAAEGSPEFSG